MFSAKRSFVLALFCAFCNLLYAQNILISYTKPDSLTVCSSDTFSLVIQNTQAALLTGASLNIALPPGLIYLAGSVNGATQQNITNLSAPVFGLPDIPANQSATIKLLIHAECAAAELLDAGQLFIAQLAVNSTLGNTQVTTTSIAVETGAIVIESIVGQVLSGERLDTLMRTVCVKNTRLGKIGNLFFEDSHPEGYEASVSGAAVQTATPVFYGASFDGSLFETVGNGDAWLDLNESVCFTEKIVITDCGDPEWTNNAVIRVGWGCDGQLCRYDSVLAFIGIKASQKVPELVFEPIWSPPTDYCGQVPAIMGFKIKNIGLADAKNTFLSLTMEKGSPDAGINPNSFRILTNTGLTPLTPNTTERYTMATCQLEVANKATVTIATVLAGDSIQFLFDVLTCPSGCKQVQPEFKLDYFYKKDCPENGFVSSNLTILPPPGFFVQHSIALKVNECFTSGQSYPLRYLARGPYLQEPGFWHLDLNLGLGLMFNDSCGLLLGQTAPQLFETSPLPDGGSRVHLAWATPFDFDTAALNFCLKYVCDTNMLCLNLQDSMGNGVYVPGQCCALPVYETSFWTPDLNTSINCAIKACGDFHPFVDPVCLKSGSNSEGPEGVEPPFTEYWDAYRLNVGYADQNNDRHADLPWSPAENQIRRDRFLPGDTLRVDYVGVLDSAIMVDTIYRMIWQECTLSDMSLNGNDAFDLLLATNIFADSSRFRLLGNIIKVKYADGTVANCVWDALVGCDDKRFRVVEQANNIPSTTIDLLIGERFSFVFPLNRMFAEGLLPRPWLSTGDSIFITTDFKLNFNLTISSNNDPDPPLIGFRTATAWRGGLFAWNDQPFKRFQYSGWKKYLESNTHSIKPCGNSTESKKFRYSLRLARENLFPNEIRPLAQIANYHQSVPDGLNLNSAELEYLVLQDSVPFLQNIALPFTQPSGQLQLDFSPVFNEPIDEGFTLRTNLRFDPNCLFNRPDSSRQFIETHFSGGINPEGMIDLDTIKNPIGFFSNTPRIRLLTSDSILYAPTNDFEIDFDLKNLVVSAAPQAWIAIVSPSGLTSDFQLLKTPQNQLLNSATGFYGLGTLNGFSSQHFNLKVKNIACETDSLYLIFGWGCTPISSLMDSDCGRDTMLIVLHLQRPELELDILSEPASLTLCDTSDWFEYEGFNAQIGYVYDLESSVRLPDGLSIVPGLCQISYPEGAAWTTITDPTPLPGNLYQWDISDILPVLAVNGLPGVNLAPQNTFHIRFKTIAECGFVINAPILYGLSGVEPCGRQSNLLNKSGAALQMDGLSPNYSAQMSIQPFGNQSLMCGGEQEFLVDISLLGTPSPEDSVYISLPLGLSLTPNTYVPGQNAPLGPPTPNAQGFQLSLPALQGGGTMSFRFRVTIDANAGCEDQSILVQTRVRAEAFCQSLGQNCTVYVATGEAIGVLQIEHPQLNLLNPQFSIVNGQVYGDLTVQNIGLGTANGAVVQVWQDLNGDGLPSANDLLLQTMQTAQTLSPGNAIELSGLLNGLDSNQLCGILFVLPAFENCSCAELVLQSATLTLAHTLQLYCDLTPVTIGVPEQIGHTYEWSSNPGISCSNCANTPFTPDPNIAAGTPQFLTLIESSDQCKIIHQFTVSFGAVATLNVENAAICKGLNTVLTADSGAGNLYNWQGPGIQNPAAPLQTVQPNSTSVYSVTVTFANGCTASASAEIVVLPLDTLQLPELKTCEGVPVDVLGTMTALPGDYQKVYSGVDGCDSIVLQRLALLPKSLTEETRSFCLGDTLKIADTTFTQGGTYCQLYTAFNGCDSTHCIQISALPAPVLTPQDTIYGTYGQIITLTGPNGFVTYIWEPLPTPPCPDCPSVNYTLDSAGYQEVHLTAINSDGCSGELIFRLLVAPPCSVDSLKIPNAFTPNGDGANDEFRVVPYEGAEVVNSLEIYDRWGAKIYQNQSNSAWDGMIDGRPAPSDVYVYVVTISCGSTSVKRFGDVTLLR